MGLSVRHHPPRSLTISTSPLLQDPPSDNFRVIKLLQCVSYRSLLRSLKLGIHWKRQDFASELLGNREVAFMVAHMQVCFLKMQWNRVVKSGLNVSLRKILLDFIASFQADNVEVIDPLAPPWLYRRLDLRTFQQFVVDLCNLAPLLVPLLEVRKLYSQYCGLQSVHPAVVTLDQVMELLVLTLIADHPHALGKLWIISRHR